MLKENDRSSINILVPGCHSLGMLGVIRSLGRAGYIVHAVSNSSDAVGLYSNFAKFSTIHPALRDSTFQTWFEAYIHQHSIRLIIPGGNFSPGEHPIFDQYINLFPVGNDKTILSRRNKYELFNTLLSGDNSERANLPPCLLVDFSKNIPTEVDLAKLGQPFFIKLDGVHSLNGKSDRVIRVETVTEVREKLQELSLNYKKAVIQGYVEGSGVGVFLLRWNNEIKLRFMHRRLHEMPHTGGASSLRESWHHSRILHDAETKLSCIRWQGIAMIEYRWDPNSDNFYLMEMNLRFWGSIHLALYAGADFPKALVDSFFGYDSTSPSQVVIGLKCRNTIPSEIGYLLSLWRDKKVSLSRKFYSIVEMIWLTLDFRVKNDLLFPGDRKIFWYKLLQFLKK